MTLVDPNYSFIVAHFSVDQEVFKDLIEKEIDRIKNVLIEFAKFMREIKVLLTIANVSIVRDKIFLNKIIQLNTQYFDILKTNNHEFH